jgi:hypothetical protein
MTLRSTQYRHCSRCGLPLEDFASQEAGVGPICRKKSNTLYSKTIVGNMALAFALASTLDGLHEECTERFNAARDKFLQNFSNMVVHDGIEGKSSGLDARDLVAACDFACSFVHPGGHHTRTQLIELIRHLGYVGLAGVIAGDASTGDARVWFDATDGRVKLSGSSNTAGWRAMRRIPGIQCPRYRGDKTPYSAPAAEAADFLGAVIRYWPMATGNTAEISEAAQNVVASIPVEVPRVAATSLATITHENNTFVLRFAWDNKLDVRGMLAELKSRVSPRLRTYDAMERTWRFHKSQLETVQSIVAKTYTNLVVR